MHPGRLPAITVLGAAAIIACAARSWPLAPRAALLSLVIAEPFRWMQVDRFMSDYMSRRRPPVRPGRARDRLRTR